MSWTLVCKVFQRKSFDLLTHRSGVLTVLFCLSLIPAGLFYFGEVLWYSYKSGSIIDYFDDNIGGRSFHHRLCHRLPIDVVYTWVNGSDPQLGKQLYKLKNDMTNQVWNNSDSSQQVCTLSDCIPANGLVIEHDTTDEELNDIFAAANMFPKIYEISASAFKTSCFLFSKKEELDRAMSLNLNNYNKKVKSIKYLFYTSDISFHFKEDLILALGLPEISEDADPKSFLSKIGDFISDFSMDTSRGIASFYVHDKRAREQILSENNFTISGKLIKFSQGHLVWNLGIKNRADLEITKNRFRDMDELRFSLRSLEKFAPWVRQVFIVTNGQVPSWLDLSNPRVSIIVHEDIFADMKDLPTFSSPAIECHLHKIPGLSENFVYLNDDIFFGMEVWPDDFIAEDGTQSIYLTYAVPDCKVGCPGSWIRDGYCDKACNCSECEWDGGDCNLNASNIRNNYGYAQNLGHFPWSNKINSQYCHPGCADNWIADKYCDASCNTYKCGFDAGDCGVENFDKIQIVPLRKNQNEYFYFGYSVLYFDLSDLISANGYVSEGDFDEEPIIRSFSYVNSSKLLTLVLRSNHSRSSIKTFLILNNEHSLNFTFNFTISVDTSIDEKNINNSKTFTPEAEVTFKPSPPLILNPVPSPKKRSFFRALNVSLDPHVYHLPSSIHKELLHILAKHEEGLLTKKGLKMEERSILRKYFKENNLEWSESSLTRFFQRSLVSDEHESNKGSSESRPNGSFSEINVRETSGRNKNDALTNDKTLRKLKHLDNRLSSGRKDSSQAIPLKRHSMQYGSLPWEKKGIFDKIQRANKEEQINEHDVWKGRHLMDAFADSIHHVNRLYNQAYGYFSRKVPAHAAHFFNKSILREMLAKFSKEFEITSSHKVRSAQDMQLAFSYYYFLMSEKEDWTLSEIFNEFDLDRSRVLSDQELRLLMAKTHKLPLFLKELVDLEVSLINCSSESQSKDEENAENYHEKKLPQVTLDLISNCSSIRGLLLKTFSIRDKYKYKVIPDGDSFVSFKMIQNNATAVVRQLDDIRKNMKKFVCLNDDLDDVADPKEAEDVRSLIKDFYLTFFPRPSQFELGNNQQNVFENMAEYHKLKRMQTMKAYLSVIFLVALIFVIFAAMNIIKIVIRCKRIVIFKVQCV